ncbi:AI-2E family transporter [Thalassoroseus pseudoceratinae]|uniref:AI-2E family transporter n=1 Tax=Thalassoroseus pseudoceratinae TaxID=2713176 RepID=UPI00141DBD3E|nr:AI-2E family transporter [Thalassoroseus pseudoceratinae]
MSNQTPAESSNSGKSTTIQWTSLAIITTLIVVIGVLFFQVVAPFLLSLFLAGVLAVICQPLYRRLCRRFQGRNRFAAGVSTGIVLLVVLIPVVMTVFLLSIKLGNFVSGAIRDESFLEWSRMVEREIDGERVASRLNSLFGTNWNALQIEREVERALQTAAKWLSRQTSGILGTAIGFMGALVAALVQMTIFIIAFYYFLADGDAFRSAAEKLIPLQKNQQDQLITKFNTTTRAIAAGTFLAAIVQGFAAAVMVATFGFRPFYLIFPLATLCSLIPLFGTALVWGPCVLWLFLDGNVWQAVVMWVLGVAIVGSMDNLVRVFVLQSNAKLHPLLGFVCVLGGIQAMGLWGVFIGPLLASILHALIQMFNTELQVLTIPTESRGGG